MTDGPAAPVADTLVVRDGRSRSAGGGRRSTRPRRDRARPRRSRRAPGARRRSRAPHAPGPGPAQLRRGGVASEEEIAARVGGRPRRACPGRVDRRTRLGPEPLAGHADSQPRLPRPRGARSPGGAGAHRRPRDVGELGGARRRRHRRATTRDPPGGIIVRDAAASPPDCWSTPPSGSSSGCEPRPVGRAVRRGGARGIADCLAVGLTGIHEMGAELCALAAYRRLVERGQFPFRNYVGGGRALEADVGSLPRARARGSATTASWSAR